MRHERPWEHPVRIVVVDDLRRPRLTVLLRPILVVPHVLWLTSWILGTFFVAIVNWFAALITGHPQAGMHDFLARYVRYYLHVSAYVDLVASPWPRFLGERGSYPVDLEVDGPELQNRWVTGFRLALAVPALVLMYVFGLMALVVGIAGWFVALALGRMPRGMRDLAAYCLRYQSQTLAYAMLLTSRYPTLYAVAP